MRKKEKKEKKRRSSGGQVKSLARTLSKPGGRGQARSPARGSRARGGGKARRGSCLLGLGRLAACQALGRMRACARPAARPSG
jgi:hypothetical protein